MSSMLCSQRPAPNAHLRIGIVARGVNHKILPTQEEEVQIQQRQATLYSLVLSMQQWAATIMFASKFEVSEQTFMVDLPLEFQAGIDLFLQRQLKLKTSWSSQQVTIQIDENSQRHLVGASQAVVVMNVSALTAPDATMNANKVVRPPTRSRQTRGTNKLRKQSSGDLSVKKHSKVNARDDSPKRASPSKKNASSPKKNLAEGMDVNMANDDDADMFIW